MGEEEGEESKTKEKHKNRLEVKKIKKLHSYYFGLFVFEPT